VVEPHPHPIRELTDPKALWSISHPTRIRLLEELIFGGPATATELADRVGESPANCSWHLRQLARFGFVEEAGGGPGRRRPWQIVLQGHAWGRGELDPELARAGEAADEVILAREVEALREWRLAKRNEVPAWRDSAFVAQSAAWLTAEELATLSDELKEILLRFLPRISDPAQRPPGSRPIRLMAWGIPAAREAVEPERPAGPPPGHNPSEPPAG
jgi:DNA-binding transcriptional ArsR family regulator